MFRMIIDDNLRAIGQPEAGVSQSNVARHIEDWGHYNDDNNKPHTQTHL